MHKEYEDKVYLYGHIWCNGMLQMWSTSIPDDRLIKQSCATVVSHSFEWDFLPIVALNFLLICLWPLSWNSIHKPRWVHYKWYWASPIHCSNLQSCKSTYLNLVTYHSCNPIVIPRLHSIHLVSQTAQEQDVFPFLISWSQSKVSMLSSRAVVYTENCWTWCYLQK